MPIRKLLLPLTGTEAGKAGLRTGLLVAERFGAHLLGLHVGTDSRDIAPFAGEGMSGPMIEQMMAASDRECAQRQQIVRAMFDGAMAAHGIARTVPQPGQPSAAFAAMVGREDEVVAQQARLADLTIVPHPEAGDDVSSSDALHAVLFDSGRPVLIAPRRVPRQLGLRVCVAWSGTAESAAALQNALPWLIRAEQVRVLWADEYQRSGPNTEALLEYLALYDVRPETEKFGPRDRDVGAGLLAAARDWGADLLTMGAYSHSRLRQLFLGGVTRHVLEHADLPVLMNR